MFLFIFTSLIIIWLTLSLVTFFYLKSAFKKYRNFPRLQVSRDQQAAVRKDFGKWDESAILKGCFLRLPFHITAMCFFLGGYGTLATLQKFFKYPDWFIDLYRHFFGKLAMKTCFNVVEQFDPRQKITNAIIISNHVSWVDLIYMGGCHEPASFVSKIQVQNVFVFNAIARYVRTLYVDRSSPEARHKIKEQILERVRQYQQNPNQHYPIIIYPEGTTTNGRSVISFKNGAFQPLCPITIFSLKYQCKQFHMGLDEVSALDHGLITMCLSPTLIVKRSEISPLKDETVESYRQRCRVKLGQQTGFELYDCDYKDISAYQKLVRQVIKQRKSKNQ